MFLRLLVRVRLDDNVPAWRRLEPRRDGAHFNCSSLRPILSKNGCQREQRRRAAYERNMALFSAALISLHQPEVPIEPHINLARDLLGPQGVACIE